MFERLKKSTRTSVLWGQQTVAQQITATRIFDRFRKDQTGHMREFYVAIITVMAIFGGVSIDLMHAELKRTKIQNTLDRAVLATANLDNEYDADETVGEYFEAMNLSSALESVTVVEGLGSKEVSVTAKQVFSANFYGLLGVDSLQAKGAATAKHSMNNIEVSMA